MKKTPPGLVVWFCGLPGSGKSTIASLVVKKLSKLSKGKVVLISMDSIRKKIFPKPTYSDEERDAAYRCLVLIASFLSSVGIVVLLDGTGHKLVWRTLARKECPNFVEAYVRCPIETCIERETNRKNNTSVRKKLYLAALERLEKGEKIKGVGKVPGIDEPFEESKKREIVLDSSRETPQELALKTLKVLRAKLEQ